MKKPESLTGPLPNQVAHGKEQASTLPVGTVTFLFTDIEGSTPLWERMPQEMQASVAQHHAILRQVIEASGGQVFQIIGDAFQSVFRLATDALSAALAVQQALLSAQWGSTGPLKVRMGLHTGPAELDTSGDAPYQVSHTLNRAARIMSAGHGGQILLSQEVKDLVERGLSGGVHLTDLGEHQLKGMRWPEHLYQATSPDLPGVFPSLSTAALPNHNLPRQLTSFIGREKEIIELHEIITSGTSRLVTLTGAGGTGKTRLGLKMCTHVADHFPDGVWLTELAPVEDPDLVAKTIAQTLGLQEVAGVPIIETLSGYLENRCLLLILDNCEHLLSECARLVDVLLRACPKLHILSTSREILNVPSEIPYRVPSLSLIDPKVLPQLEDLAAVEAVKLFVERATQAAPGFRLGENNAHEVALICQRLDGIPLAIELAAARVRVMTIEQITARLSDVFRLLTRGARSVMPRQQTLKATIDWSYSLLSAHEQLVLQRLSVFAGSWHLEAAESVCAGDGIEPFEVLDLLAGLVDKSLVIAPIEEGKGVRYHMLDTIRQYARDRLLESGGSNVTRDRHLAFYMKLGKEASQPLVVEGQLLWLNRLEEELDNLRLALERSLHGHIVDGMYLAHAIIWFWHIRHGVEGTEWVERLIKSEEEHRGDHPLKIGVQEEYYLLGWCSIVLACNNLALICESPFSTEKRRAMLEDAAILCQQIGEPARFILAGIYVMTSFTIPDLAESIAWYKKGLDILHHLQEPILHIATAVYFERRFYEAFTRGKIAEAIGFLTESLQYSRKSGNLNAIATSLLVFGKLSFSHGEYAKGNAFFAESIQTYKEVSSPNAVNVAYIEQYLCSSAENEQNEDVYRQAQHALSYFRETRDMGYFYSALKACLIVEWSRGNFQKAEDLGKEWCTLSSISHSGGRKFDQELWLGKLALTQKDYENAGMRIRAAASKIDTSPEYLFTTIVILSYTDLLNLVDTLAVYWAEVGKRIFAAKLFGAVKEKYRLSHLGFPVRQRSEHDQALISVRQALDEDAFSAAWKAGRAMTLEQALQYALEEINQR